MVKPIIFDYNAPQCWPLSRLDLSNKFYEELPPVAKIRLFFRMLQLTCLTLFLTGCHWVILNPKGVIAADEKNIVIIATALMLLIVVPVIVMTYAIAWRYRANNPAAKYDPEWSHSNLIEIVCWTIPCIIIAVLGTITWTSTHRLDPYRPLDNQTVKPLVIQAVALEWKWLFIYPEQHIATINQVAFPVNVPVRFEISAEGPMNSFMIPQIAGQIYAMAGMRTKLNVLATHVGIFRGISANFSGDGFSDMNFDVRVGTQADFNQWVKSVQTSTLSLNDQTYQGLITPSEKLPITYYKDNDTGLFDNIIMKDMMPMSQNNNTQQ